MNFDLDRLTTEIEYEMIIKFCDNLIFETMTTKLWNGLKYPESFVEIMKDKSTQFSGADVHEIYKANKTDYFTGLLITLAICDGQKYDLSQNENIKELRCEISNFIYSNFSEFNWEKIIYSELFDSTSFKRAVITYVFGNQMYKSDISTETFIYSLPFYTYNSKLLDLSMNTIEEKYLDKFWEFTTKYQMLSSSFINKYYVKISSNPEWAWFVSVRSPEFFDCSPSIIQKIKAVAAKFQDKSSHNFKKNEL